MPRLRLRNKRRDRSSSNSGSNLASVLHVMAWMQYSQLDTEPAPSSPLEGLLQLLRWSDLQQLACTERAHRTYHQARSLLAYGRRKADIDTANPDGLDHCDICLARMGRFRVNCALCHTALLCANCVCRVTMAAIADFPFPRFHRIGSRQGSPPEPLRQGDVLCLDCYPTAATYAQSNNLRFASCFSALMDGMLGYGAWSPLNSRWGSLTFRMIIANRHREEFRQIMLLERQTYSVVPDLAVGMFSRATVQL